MFEWLATKIWDVIEPWIESKIKYQTVRNKVFQLEEGKSYLVVLSADVAEREIAQFLSKTKANVMVITDATVKVIEL